MIQPTVTAPNGSTRAVRNLGWLLRNWKRVDRFEVAPCPPDGAPYPPDALLVAYCKDGTVYRTPYMSREVLAGWLNRPVFRGAPVNWYGTDTMVGPGLK